ncbi:hypothetical protein [Halalkalibacter nanhaiisediminis]|uniref:Uncharacterized protein n=1 Tax=Halalkalibacter nanhaiisediminis TaxID=688079 RepID=A0A562QK87_9BACI|nr:hypothetical protein [Halalkalibacter nanhaiisediminis]TWI57083.1 hypothetical protein IQ10_01786 [Halalkalibacter nanhaiisediminis]
MELLDWLKQQYQWQDVKFINEELIETEQGKKRLCYWSDKALLDWHIEWRDGCSVTPYVLADRMIRSKEQEAALSWKEGWLTVHDEVADSHFVKARAREIGTMIGAMIQHGIATASPVKTLLQDEPIFRQLYMYVSHLSKEQQLLVTSLLNEAEIRMRKATALRKQLKDEPLPLLDPIKSVKQAKQVYQVLIWNGTMGYPERGYRSLRTFLGDWLDVFGKEAFCELLGGMYLDERLTREQAILLLSECLKPYELNQLVILIKQNPSEQKINQTLEQATKEWEQSKHLVQMISASIDQRKKVLTQ